MSRRYTAQEMRDMADYREAWGDKDGANDMLRQAADDLEREEKRERKYEYAAKSNYDGVVYPEHCDEAELRDHFSCMKCDEYTVVRREVGEWEEVRDAD